MLAISADVQRLLENIDPALPGALARNAPTVQPLIAETGNRVYPLQLKGSCFLVGYRNKARVITTRHQVGEALVPMRVFIRDDSAKFLPLTKATAVPPQLVGDDWSDICVMDIDMPAAKRGFGRHAKLTDLDRFKHGWDECKDVAPFFVVGFPHETSAIDFEKARIQSVRSCLIGRYAGPGVSRHIHEIHIDGSELWESWSGFSGGGVFSWLRRIGCVPRLALCGMAIQGTPESGIVKFVSAEILLAALEAW